MPESLASGDADVAAFVRDLLRELDGTSITRLELRHGDLRVALRRLPGTAPAMLARAAGTAVAAEPARPAHWHAVVSPLTGIFYSRPSPDKEPFVQIGSHVESDDVVALIETMKMFNEITADVAGAVREILMPNGSIVEAGQALLYIEPAGAVNGPQSGVI